MLKFLFTLCFLGLVAHGGWYLWDHFPIFSELIHEKVHPRDFHTLEIRFTADDIIRRHKDDLIKGNGYSFLEPQLTFYPYLMMDMKFSSNPTSTQEGILLWGLYDGEMVIDTASWERSHGFEDCLLAHANHHDFKILKTILDIGNSIDRDALYEKFNVEAEMVDKWVSSCRDKKLIVASGNKLRIHLQDPYIECVPMTHLAEPLVTQQTKSTVRIKKRYTVAQIRKLTAIAFGQNFAIRKMQQVFLPVYQISVQNPDGSIRTTYWNALNGEVFKVQ